MFRSVQNSQDPRPLNDYLLNDDCACILKKCYQNNTKTELVDDEEVMENFFGSIEVGKETLQNWTDDEWDTMEY